MIGFENIETTLDRNFYNQKLHHAIIIAGKKGIGKASFVKYFCEKIITNSHGDPKADFRLIEKIIDKNVAKKTIGIDEIRLIADFLHYTSASSQYKFIIIDAVCELTPSASNSLLKSLEEPKKNVFYFLVAHNISKVIPTILSRCLTIKIPDFSKEVFLAILQKNNVNFTIQECDFLAHICDNCPALAINNGEDLIKCYQLFLDSILNQKISDELLKKISEKNFSSLVSERILLHFFSQFLKISIGFKINFFFKEDMVFDILLQKFNNSQILNLAEEIVLNIENINRFHLDKKTNFINIFNRICYV